jgi:hypothetical protein
MTEQDWLDCEVPQQMLDFCRHRVSARKLRLYLCGCCRQRWELLDEARRRAVEVAERYADGQASADERLRATVAISADRHTCRDALQNLARRVAWQAGRGNVTLGLAWLFRERVDATLCEWLREIVGNPFRPAPLEPGWLRWNDGCVAALAQGIYEDRAFERMPILADALEDAGCTEPALLDHLRGPWPHVRGCWVLDQLLGR